MPRHALLSLPVLSLLLLTQMVPGVRAGDKDGWTNLTEGGDLKKHWNTTGNWSLKDGVLTLEPRPGEKGWTRYDAYLWAKDKYQDFEIEFEYKVNKGGNSGFYFNVGDLKDPVGKGIEVQIYDSMPRKDGKLTDHDSGGVIPGIPPTKHAAKPAGEWNHFHIAVKDKKALIKLNGEMVNDVPLDHPRLKGRPTMGYIGFQDHGLPLQLRNVKVRQSK